MNIFTGIGRLTKDPEVRYSQNDTSMAIARYTIAIDRQSKGDNSTDFISCVCFGKTAEFAEKYLHKGTKIAITGRVQTGSYNNKDGQKVYTTDIVVDKHFFCESREEKPAADCDGFADIPDGVDEELPFARPTR